MNELSGNLGVVPQCGVEPQMVDRPSGTTACCPEQSFPNLLNKLVQGQAGEPGNVGPGVVVMPDGAGSQVGGASPKKAAPKVMAECGLPWGVAPFINMPFIITSSTQAETGLAIASVEAIGHEAGSTPLFIQSSAIKGNPATSQNIALIAGDQAYAYSQSSGYGALARLSIPAQEQAAPAEPAPLPEGKGHFGPDGGASFFSPSAGPAPLGQGVTAARPGGAFVAPEPVLEQIVQQAQLVLSQGRSEFSLKLKPEALGELRVHLILEDGRVSVELIAQNAQAKALMESHLPQLRLAFREQAIEVGQFAVYTGQGPSQFDSPARRSSRWTGGPERVTSGGEEGPDISSRVLGQAWHGQNTVDYRA